MTMFSMHDAKLAATSKSSATKPSKKYEQMNMSTASMTDVAEMRADSETLLSEICTFH